MIKKAGFGLTYQVTPSMPQGFYFIKPIKDIKRGDIVIFSPPPIALTFLLKNHLIPQNGLLMKYVFALPGDKTCKHDKAIWINSHNIAPVYQLKDLPNKKFCQVLKNNEYLLMSIKVQRSFDGRYFGPVNKKNIIGRGERRSPFKKFF
jgi:type IV secretory pathway protease TraF